MRVATLVLGLAFTGIITIWGFLGLMLASWAQTVSEPRDPATLGLGGGESLLLVVLLFLLGSAFALGKPRFAAVLFLVAAFVSFLHTIDGITLLFPLWGVVALILTILSFFGRNEMRRGARAASE